MSKKFVVAILLVIVGIVIAGFFLIGQRKGQEEGSSIENISVENNPITKEADEELDENKCKYNQEYCREVAVKKQDPSICAMINDQGSIYKSEENLCYREVAVAKQDSAICLKITADSEWDWNYCYSEIAKAKQDSSLCKNCTGYANGECYSEIAKIKQDASLCKEIKYVETSDKCYLAVSFAKQDASICDNIKGDPWKKEDCNYGIFKVTKDPSICGKLQNLANKDNCYQSLK